MSLDAPSPLLTPELLAQLERLEFVTRKMFRGRFKGERRSTRRGQSVEFADFRLYAPGDDLRFIDWNGYARLDRLFLKLFMEEEDLHVSILLDTSASMGFGSPTKLRYAQQFAAALGFIALVRGDRLRVETIPRAAGSESPTLRGRHQWPRLVSTLEARTAAGVTDLVAGVKQFCLRNPGRGIVILLTDLLDKHGFETALRYLVGQRFDVHVLHILSTEERDPDVQGDLRLIDSEDEGATEISASELVVARYRQALARFIERAREYCTRRGLGYLLVDVRDPLERVVGHALRRQGMVR